MKRLHIHLTVADINESVHFYSALFNNQPNVIKNDYAKWMLDDPRVNFAISNRSDKPGLDHLGIQAESDSELTQLKDSLEQADMPIESQEGTACCYARSDKHWTTDPQGIPWETFHSLAEIPTFNESTPQQSTSNDNNACTPTAGSKNCC